MGIGGGMNAGWWVFAWGGLFDSRAAEDPPLLHAVNFDNGPDTLCGLPRFTKEAPGGAWRPQATPYVEKGDAMVGQGGKGVQVCPRCADELVKRAADRVELNTV